MSQREEREEEGGARTNPNSRTLAESEMSDGAMIVTAPHKISITLFSSSRNRSDSPQAPLAAPNTTQNATAPPVDVAPSIAKIIPPMSVVTGTATVRFPNLSAAKPMLMRERQAEALRIGSCVRGGVSAGCEGVEGGETYGVGHDCGTRTVVLYEHLHVENRNEHLSSPTHQPSPSSRKREPQLTPSMTKAHPKHAHQVAGCLRKLEMSGNAGGGLRGGMSFRGRMRMLARRRRATWM